MPLPDHSPRYAAMPGPDDLSQRRTKRRPRRRLWIAVAIAVPVVVMAIPRAPTVAPLPASRLAPIIDPGEVLTEFWRSFEGGEENHSIAAFDRWVEGTWNDSGARASLVRDRASVGKDGDGRKLTLDGPGFSGRAELIVRPRRWPVAEFALAAEDLSCVLCHVHIDGTRGPARAFSGVEPADHQGKRLSITGGLVVESHAPLFNDPAVDLGSLRLASGTLEGPQGRVVALGAEEPLRASVGGERPLPKQDPVPLQGPVSFEDTVNGHLELVGNDARPIKIRGNLVIEGDLLLRGAFSGDGVLFVDGSVFLPDGIEALEGSKLTLVAMGGVLVGDVLRPRYDESLAVTGDPEGSLGFLIESLARFNFARGKRQPLGWMPGQAGFRLAGSRATGDWYDPALERLKPAAFAVGPALLANGAPWFDPGLLREPIGTARGLTLDATVVTPSVFIGVASGLRILQASDTDNPSRIEAGAVAPGAMLVRGSIAASHAAIHAPAGLRIIDAVVPRSLLSVAFGGGVEAVLESISAEGSYVRSLGNGAVIQGASVLPERPRARLRSPGEPRADPGR